MEIQQFLSWRLRRALASLRPLRPRSQARGRVLALVTGGIGDKLMALPAIRHFRRAFPDAEFTLLLSGVVPPFFAREADRILPVAKADIRGLLREARRRYDACFANSLAVFEVSFEVAAFLTGAREMRGPRFGFLPASRTVYAPSYVFGEGHETVVNLRGAGGETTEDRLPYPLELPDLPPPCAPPDVILHPGSSAAGEINRWPTSSYARLARDLQAAGYSVLAVGTPGERELLAALRELAGPGLGIETGLSLENLALLLARTRLVVANDSGIGHLAAAVGAPLITIMGATRPERIAPVGERAEIIGPRCEFGGCYNTSRAAECRRCIDRITPEEVREAALGKLR